MAAADPRVDDEAFVTLATNDTYALGALVLGNSLRSVGTSRQLAIMITHGVTATMRQQLSEVFDYIRVVDVLDSRDTMNLDLLTRPDLGVTFTKLHCWRLTQYSKAVFMDADTLVIQNIDELFDREELSAAPDAGWPDCFNSGVFVFRPSEATYEALLQFAVSHGSFDGGDQGLLNLFFSDWATKDIARHLPFLYNVVSQAFYSYLPAFKQYGKDVKVVHFIGAVKPWHQAYNTATGTVSTQQGVGHNTDFLQLWWKTFMDKVQPHLNSDVSQHLNIYEEYPLPPHPYSNYQEDMSSHEMTAPYVPPQVDTYYHEESPSENAHAPTGQYRVENKDDRDFSHYEAFYSEPPMSQSDNYPTPQEEVYQAKEFEQSLHGFSQEPETDAALDHTHEPTSTSHELSFPETPSYPVSSDNSPIHSTNTAHEVETSPVVKSSPEPSPPPSPPPESGLATADDDEQSVIRTDTLLSTLATETDTPEEVTDNTASEPEVDISEGVASLQLDGRSYTDDELENRHRQYDWEKGQIDYLGIDSFSNILTKLQSTISKHSEGQADSE